MVGAGAILQALYSGMVMQGFGQYAVVLEQQFGWSKSTLSAAYSMNRAESALLGPLQGWALDRFGAKRVARIGIILAAIGLFAFSRIENLWQFFAAFVLISIGTSLSGFLTVTVAIVQWFERRRARALSIGSMGFAIGGVLIPLLAFFIKEFGWRPTAAGSALIYLVCAWPLATYLEGTPADHGTHVDGVEPTDVDQSPHLRAEGLTEIHFTAREAMRTRAFWFISLGHMSALFVVGAVLAHLSLLLTSEHGYSLQKASFVAGGLPLVQIVGMLLGGWLGDRFNKRLLASVAMFGHTSGLLILAFANGALMIWTFVVLHGLAWGVRGPLMQALRADYFGSTSFGSIMGVSSLIVMLGTVLGPLVAGILADTTGSYRTGFVVLALLALSGVVFFTLARPPEPPSRD